MKQFRERRVLKMIADDDCRPLPRTRGEYPPRTVSREISESDDSPTAVPYGEKSKPVIDYMKITRDLSRR